MILLLSKKYKPRSKFAAGSRMNLHEEMFARNFIIPAKRERYLSLLEYAKGRSKLVFGLNHCGDIDMRYATPVPVGQQYVDAILSTLKQKGAPDWCHVMSSNPDTDDQDLPLQVALSGTVGMGYGTLISCTPGKLAYFEFEDPGERYILER
jgi:hypothetical protein